MKTKNPVLCGIVSLDLIISGLSLVILVLVTVAAVFMRYGVNDPFPWIEEVQMLLFVWASFFGASVSFCLGGHIAIDILVDLFPKKLQRILEQIIAIMIFCSLLYMMWLQIQRGFALVKSGRATNILRIPMYVDYFGVALAFLMMTIRFTVWHIGCLIKPRQTGVNPL